MYQKAILRILVTLLLGVSTLYSLNITNQTHLDNFTIGYYPDTNGTQTLFDLLDENFTDVKSHNSFGDSALHAWYKIPLTNVSGTPQKLSLHFELGFNITDTVCIYDVRKGVVTRELCIDEYEDIIDNEEYKASFYGKDLLFDIALDKNESTDIYIYNKVIDFQFIEIGLYDQKHSKKELVSHFGLYYIIVSILFGFAIYHIILFVISKYYEYVYYTLYLVSSALWGGSQTGYIAEIYQPLTYSAFFNSLVDVIPMFSVLFARSFFRIRKINKLVDNLLISVVIIFSAHVLLFGDDNLFTVYAVLYFFVVFTTSLGYLAYKGIKYAKIFFVGNIIFTIGALVTNLTYMGAIEYSSFNKGLVLLTIFVEAMIFAIILSYRIRDLRNEKEEKEAMLLRQNNLVVTGQMLQSIAHQWRQPLALINSNVMAIDLLTDNEKISPILDEIENTTGYMSETIESFRNFMRPDKVSKTFFLKEVVDATLPISLANKSSRITISVNVKKDISITGNMNELQQVILVLINNAFESIKMDGKIFITIDNGIKVCDTGSGIADVDSVFDEYYTTKQDGTGVGLYIAKMIIEKRFKGSITAFNNEKGACFYIKL